MSIFNSIRFLCQACVLALVFSSGVSYSEEAGTAANAAQNGGAQNSIESLEHTTLENGRIVLKLGMKLPLKSVPPGFTINQPPRIVLDFIGTKNGLGKNTYEVQEHALRNLNIVQAGSRTRVVMNLNKAASHEAKLEGKYVLVTVQPSEAMAAAPNATQRFAETSIDVPQTHALKNIDFRRGTNGEGRVIIDLSDANAGIDIRNMGGSLVVDFLNTTISRDLERRLDVADFTTPVQAVETFSQGKNTRMNIVSQGLWEYSAYQTDTQFIVDVRKVVVDPNKLVQSGKPGYSGEKLSLAFQNQDVRAILQVFTEFTGMNIVVSDSVTGSLTLRLKDVPWDQALDIILNARGLDKRKNGNVVWVAPRDELALKEKQELEFKHDISNLEPLTTELFKLRFATASNIAEQITGKSLTKDTEGDVTTKGQSKSTTKEIGKAKSMLSEKGSVNADDRTNSIYIKDTASVIEEIRAFINGIDIPVRQVMIEARIVEATDNFAKSLGARLGMLDRSNSGMSLGGDNRLSIGGNLAGTGVNTSTSTSNSGGNATTDSNNTSSKNVSFANGAASINSASGSTGSATSGSNSSSSTADTKGYDNSLLNVNLPSTNLGSPAGVLSMILFKQGASRFLNLELSALQADGKGKIVSNPRVVAPNNSQATIEQGVNLPCTRSTGTTYYTDWRKASLQLVVKPRITPDDSILLDLMVAKDTAGELVGGCRAINTKQITTQVLVENGGTAVIGGIYLQEENEDVVKVPLLGDIPVLGNLFKTTYRSDKKTELLIFITPKILNESLSIH